ncbi:MAG: biopolymer transporter ExbD [Phycisphaerales bacterium]|jgi:biopolymer transport protein ExbD
MRQRFHKPQTGMAKINVTPLIDVVMVLIVFYLIVGKLASDRLARVELPGSRTGKGDEPAGALVVNVVKHGNAAEVVIDGNSIGAGQLAATLKAANDTHPDQPVHLRADRSLPFSRIEPVLQACREAGLKSVKLVASREGGG